MRKQPTVSVGDKFVVKGESVVIVAYENNRKVTVRFPDGTEKICQLHNLRVGTVASPTSKTVCGVGFAGIGTFSNSTHPRVHKIWTHVLGRCYNVKCQSVPRNHVYIGCTVHKDWHNFQTFAKDYLELSRGNTGWQLDKDLLVRGNRTYSRDTCVVIPSELNKLLIKADARRGNYCIGVTFNKRQQLFRAQLRAGGKNTAIGCYHTELEAFQAYKTAKESFIKQQANKWKDQIEPRAYEALMNYTVEITD